MGAKGDIWLNVTMDEARVLQAVRKMNAALDGTAQSTRKAEQAGQQWSESMERGADGATRRIQQTERALQQVARAASRAQSIQPGGFTQVGRYEPSATVHTNVLRHPQDASARATARALNTAHMTTAKAAMGSEYQAAATARELALLSQTDRLRREHAEAKVYDDLQKDLRASQVAAAVTAAQSNLQREAGLDRVLAQPGTFMTTDERERLARRQASATGHPERNEAAAQAAAAEQELRLLQQVGQVKARQRQEQADFEKAMPPWKLTEGMDRYKRLLNEVNPKTRQWLDGMTSGLNSVTGSIGRMVMGYWAVTRAMSAAHDIVRLHKEERQEAINQITSSALSKGRLVQLAGTPAERDALLGETKDVWSKGYGSETEASDVVFALRSATVPQEDRDLFAKLGARGIIERIPETTAAIDAIRTSFGERAGSFGDVLGKVMVAQRDAPASAEAIAIAASKSAVSSEEMQLRKEDQDAGEMARRVGWSVDDLAAFTAVMSKAMGPRRAGTATRHYLRTQAEHADQLGLNKMSMEEQVRATDQYLQGRSAKSRQKYWGRLEGQEVQGVASNNLEAIIALRNETKAANRSTAEEKISLHQGSPELNAPQLLRQANAEQAIAKQPIGITGTLAETAYSRLRTAGIKQGEGGFDRAVRHGADWLDYYLTPDDEYIQMVADKYGIVEPELERQKVRGVANPTFTRTMPKHLRMGDADAHLLVPGRPDTYAYPSPVVPPNMPAAPASQPAAAASQPATSFDRSVQDFGRIVENLRTVVADATGNGLRRTNNTILAGADGPDDDPKGF